MNTSSTAAIKAPSVVSTIIRTSNFLDRLSLTHAILGESVCIVSALVFDEFIDQTPWIYDVSHIFSSYGLTLLALLASCLMHLVATTYFLFSELLNDMVSKPHITLPFNFLIISGWICCFHAISLVLFSHRTITSNRRTVSHGLGWGRQSKYNLMLIYTGNEEHFCFLSFYFPRRAKR